MLPNPKKGTSTKLEELFKLALMLPTMRGKTITPLISTMLVPLTKAITAFENTRILAHSKNRRRGKQLKNFA